MERKKITTNEINVAVAEVQRQIAFRLKQKGPGVFVSQHEILGIVTEEYHELIEAVENGAQAHVKAELMDIAVACVLGVACIENDKLDW